jgi:RNA polymerase sigma factor (TIGR02999 family)
VSILRPDHPSPETGPPTPMNGDITRLLKEWRAGNDSAREEVVARTYDELRRVARAQLRRERQGHPLQTTALLHEAYLRLLRSGPGTVETRDAFFRLMATEMRRRLVDHARRRLTQKRGRDAPHQPVDPSAPIADLDGVADVEVMLQRLDRALNDLDASCPRAACVVRWRFIAGLTTEETAAAAGLSTGTVKREWTFARAWLAAALACDTRKSQ